MTIAAWPVAHRSQLVHAFKPGEHSGSESPFRTLRKHAWATSGVRIVPRPGVLLDGQLTIFSSLNMDSARHARHGSKDAAVRIAAAATELESGPEFALLRAALSELPATDARGVVDGVIPVGASEGLASALRAVAGRTEEIRERELSVADLAAVIAGRVKEVHDGYVILVLMSGPEALVPLWMAGAARRATVGALLALVTDKLDGASAVIEAVPAIDVHDETQSAAFTPFGRGDKRAVAITSEDERLLAGEPRPLRILVPVTIH
jgi:hypothetical protein